MVSSLPFLGPVGAVRIGMDDDGRLIVDPTLPELEASSLDLLVVGTKDAITMVECGAEEIAEDDAARGARARTPGDPGALRGAGGAAPRRREAEDPRPGD